MEKIKQNLETKGWKVDYFEEKWLMGERNSTGKKIIVQQGNKEKLSSDNEVELLRMHTKKGIHPFLANEENNEIVYYDLLFEEKMKII